MNYKDFGFTAKELTEAMEKVKIELEDWDYHCSDGCCSNYGTLIKVNGVECENEYAGDSVLQALEVVLNQLGVEFEINEI